MFFSPKRVISIRFFFIFMISRVSRRRLLLRLSMLYVLQSKILPCFSVYQCSMFPSRRFCHVPPRKIAAEYSSSFYFTEPPLFPLFFHSPSFIIAYSFISSVRLSHFHMIPWLRLKFCFSIYFLLTLIFFSLFSPLFPYSGYCIFSQFLRYQSYFPAFQNTTHNLC